MAIDVCWEKGEKRSESLFVVLSPGIPGHPRLARVAQMSPAHPVLGRAPTILVPREVPWP